MPGKCINMKIWQTVCENKYTDHDNWYMNLLYTIVIAKGTLIFKVTC